MTVTCDKRHVSRHLQFWPSASCTMYIVCTCSTAHLFPVLIYAPAFVVADHRGQDPASSVLSFEGRCYLLIQIQTKKTDSALRNPHSSPLYITNYGHFTYWTVFRLDNAYFAYKTASRDSNPSCNFNLEILGLSIPPIPGFTSRYLHIY